MSVILGRCARGVGKWSETAIARIYVRSLCRWAVARTLAWVFLGSLCYRGGCKRSETAIARIYVRSLRRWAVAPTLVSFSLARCARGGCKNWDCANLRLLAVPLGGCANACVSFSLARCAIRAAASGRKLRLPEFTFQLVAVASGKARGVAWILTVRYSHMLTCTLLRLMLALANLHLDTYSWILLLTYTWILTLAYSHLDSRILANLHLDTCSTCSTCSSCSSSPTSEATFSSATAQLDLFGGRMHPDWGQVWPSWAC